MNRPEYQRIFAARDPALSATILSAVPLFYAEGADSTLDRPPHVRAGSGLTWFHDRLAAIQDDANFIALVDPATLHVNALPLPADEDGRRQFDDHRGTKHLKLDLEACTTVEGPNGQFLLALGSGSTPLRERLLLHADPAVAPVALFEARALYARLREAVRFSGSELNLEGAAWVDGSIRLFNRGNGAARRGLQPVNASCDLAWHLLEAYIRSEGTAAPPTIQRVVQYELGSLDSLRLGFTDARATVHGMLYTAAAEDSPDAVQDGYVAGSVLGIIRDGETPRWVEFLNTDGTEFRGKVEAVCESRSDPNRLFLLVDADDPELPTLLCEAALAGPW